MDCDYQLSKEEYKNFLRCHFQPPIIVPCPIEEHFPILETNTQPLFTREPMGSLPTFHSSSIRKRKQIFEKVR